MNKNNKIFLIFDLDGVILDSENNMRIAWNKVCKEFNLKKNFSLYKKYVGLPFKDILKKIKIKKNHKKIQEYYSLQSRNYNLKLKLFPGAKKTLDLLNKKKINYSIVTSKDLIRTKAIIKIFQLKPISIHCPKSNLRGKPYPDQLLECIRKNKVKKFRKVYYVGDTFYDYLAASSCKINFIFSSYGFGNSKRVYKNKLKKITEILNFLN
tara:strand:+ start:1014 stop:1640 length:627 start_codon:yes stop_codon:yes gene_type:complete